MYRPIKKQRGFSIIELMLVVAIVSILAVIAIPVYADYTTRAKVSEGLSFLAEAKTTVTEYYYSNKVIPESNVEAGLPDPSEYNHKHITRLEVGNVPVAGSITVAFSMPILGSENQLQLVPTIVNGEIIWTCRPADTNGIATSRVPPNCRN